jgi:hypothetical protein
MQTSARLPLCYDVKMHRRRALQTRSGRTQRAKPNLRKLEEKCGKEPRGDWRDKLGGSAPLKAITDASVFAAETAAVNESQAEADAAAMCKVPRRVGKCCLKKD